MTVSKCIRALCREDLGDVALSIPGPAADAHDGFQFRAMGYFHPGRIQAAGEAGMFSQMNRAVGEDAGGQGALQVHGFHVDRLQSLNLNAFSHQQVPAPDFAQNFGIGAEFHRFLGVDAAGHRTFNDEAAAMNGGSEEGPFFVDRDISPGADALGAALPDFHVPQVDEGAAIGALGGGRFGGDLVDRPAVETNHLAAGDGLVLGGGMFRVFAAPRHHLTIRGAASGQD